MPAPENPHAVRLGARLRALRSAAGYSGNAFARELGWLQSRVSKIETGKQLPTSDDLQAWTDATGASDDAVGEVESFLAAARVEYATWREISRRTRGLAGRQEEHLASETASTYLGEYVPSFVPGILQTPAYARALLLLPGGPLSSGETVTQVDELVKVRMRRHDLIYQPGRLVQAVIPEEALLRSPGDRDVLLGQLDRLLTVSGLVSVDLRVLPLDAPLPVVAASGFSLEDDDRVIVETEEGEKTVRKPDDVAVFRATFDALLAATEGVDAVGLVRRAMERLRDD